RPDAECGRGDNCQTDDLDLTHCGCPFVPRESTLTSHRTHPPPVIAVTKWRKSRRTASAGERVASAGSQAGRSGGGLGCCLPLSAGARMWSPFLVFIHAVHLPQL